MDPEIIMTGISNEINATLKLMSKSKTPEEKLQYSEVVKNLCDSLGVFLSLIGDMDSIYDDDDPIPF